MSVAPAEVQSGLSAWTRAELPTAPLPRGIQWMAAIGPGVIVLGLSIGSGEFLLGPAAFLRYSITLLWVTSVAVLLQTLFNMEAIRYTLATGEPAFTGFMRTKPHATFWAWCYALLCFLQFGWPAWAGTAAGAICFLGTGNVPGAAERDAVYLIGVATFFVCVGILLIGRRVERTLEILNWILVIVMLGGFMFLALRYASAHTWLRGIAGLVAYDVDRGTFAFIPQGADWFLLGAFAAYSGAGGMGNLMLSNWARDKGYGMGRMTGYIPAVVGGRKVNLAHTGTTFTPNSESMREWHNWWRIVRADQWGVFFTGAILGMLLPALLYITFLEPGTEVRGLGAAAALAQAASLTAGPVIALLIAFMAAWILFKSQLDILEGTTRVITDILWTGSSRVRAWRGGDVRIIYYFVLGIIVVWGCLALRLAQPLFLLQLGANMGGIVFVISSLHLLYVNTKLLPPELRPSIWRRLALLATALFYGAFVTLWLSTLI